MLAVEGGGREGAKRVAEEIDAGGVMLQRAKMQASGGGEGDALKREDTTGAAQIIRTGSKSTGGEDSWL